MSLAFQIIRRFIRDLFISIGLLVLVLIAGTVYSHSGSPHFSGVSPSAVDVSLSVSSSNTYRRSITDRAACDMILHEFRQARRVFFLHRVEGEITFRYDNGAADVVKISPGSPAGACYFLYLGRTYRLPSERFYQAFKAGGINFSETRR
jgi:hypothetical protein